MIYCLATRLLSVEIKSIFYLYYYDFDIHAVSPTPRLQPTNKSIDFYQNSPQNSPHHTPTPVIKNPDYPHRIISMNKSIMSCRKLVFPRGNKLVLRVWYNLCYCCVKCCIVWKMGLFSSGCGLVFVGGWVLRKYGPLIPKASLYWKFFEDTWSFANTVATYDYYLRISEITYIFIFFLIFHCVMKYLFSICSIFKMLRMRCSFL